jgi:hypothetical protein
VWWISHRLMRHRRLDKENQPMMPSQVLSYVVVLQASGRVRIEIARRARISTSRVIVDFGAQGHATWSEQFLGEVQWFPFEPSAVERAWARAVWRAFSPSAASPIEGVCA